MNLRQTLILAAALLLGCLTVGVYLGRPAAAEPKADATAAGRYQLAPISDAARGSVVVMDTATGECWSNDTGGIQHTWHAMGLPSKAK